MTALCLGAGDSGKTTVLKEMEEILLSVPGSQRNLIKQKASRTEEPTEEQTQERIDGRMEEQMEERTEEDMVEQMTKQTEKGKARANATRSQWRK